ncbi:MAG: sugar phosphate isomerase/epimerase [Anaerolineales bacterium]|nr:sugar phosphate isomerase/epimerase [Anaerolineales bacterium]
MNPQIALQLYSVRNELQRDYLATLEKVAEIGYKNLELLTTVTDDGLVFGPNISPVAHLRELERLGLKAMGCHMMPKQGMEWEKVIQSCAETGATALVIPFWVFNNRQDVLGLCETLNRAGELGQKHGVQVYYHNHFQEFQSFDGEVVMDTLLTNTNPALVKFEFDTYWSIRGGQDPLAWLEKFGKRCDLIHQKDMPSGVTPVNLFEVLAQKPNTPLMEVFMSISDNQFTEIGAGTLNISDIIAAGKAYGEVKYIVVEQDRTTKGELGSVAISYQNLSRLLET